MTEYVEMQGDDIVVLVKARDLLHAKRQLDAYNAVLDVLKRGVLVTTKEPTYHSDSCIGPDVH